MTCFIDVMITMTCESGVSSFSLSLININGLADKRKIRGRKQIDDKKNMRLGENVWHQGVTGF